MTTLEWILGGVLVSIYVVCLFTVCSLTFRKGYTALGFFGFLLPFLWLIGAILPPKVGSVLYHEEPSKSALFQEERSGN